MQPEFWQDRWASNQIGFHQREVNPYLQRHWPVLGLPEGAKVLVPHVSHKGVFKVYQAGQIELWCGDFFSLDTQALVGCRGVYDRAALIALPPLMRAQYAEHLNALLPSGCQGLLVTLDYDQAQKAGPPFAVSDEEVQVLLAPHWALERLEERDILGESWKFVQDGVTRLEERAYRLTRL